MLADEGHQVTVLFLKGKRVENETAEYWIDWYAQLGIEFVPLPFESTLQHGFAPFWQRRYYSFYRWLSEQDRFDVVHTSEWRGGAYYALAAKRLSLRFQNTLFLVKASSPHIWNRHYQMRTIENDSMLACSHAEQKTIEWADIVISGSAHLLSFMEDVGYALPEGRLYVQPNVIDLEELDVNEQRPNYNYGQKVKSDELVFFGRLEARKGLEIFCDALDSIAKGPVQPKKVYFLGKQGQNMPSHPDLPNIQYIKWKAENWPFPVEVISDRDQKDAISFLCEKPRIAVMPSIIENSTMAVYEALVHKIPFLATKVGGTQELIDAEYHGETLTAPEPTALASDLLRILEEGATVARASFDNAANLEIWRRFHTWLSHRLSNSTVAEVIAELSYDSSKFGEDRRPVRPIGPAPGQTPISPKVAALVYHHDDVAGLNLTLQSVIRQNGSAFDEVLVITDGDVRSSDLRKYRQLKNDSDGVRFLDNAHKGFAQSVNDGVELVNADVLVSVRAGDHILKPGFVEVIRTAFGHPHIQIASSVYDHNQRVGKDDLSAVATAFRYLPMGGDLAAHVFHDGALGGSCFAVRRDLFLNLGGFHAAYHVSHIETEFLARSIVKGEELWIIPDVLYECLNDTARMDFNRLSGRYMRVKPFLDGAPYSVKRLFLRLGEDLGTLAPSESVSASKTQKQICRYAVLNTSPKEGDSKTRLGLVFDIDSGSFGCILGQDQRNSPEASLTVTTDGKRVSRLEFEPLGEGFRVARWKLELEPSGKPTSTIQFRCENGTEKLERFASVIWASDGSAFINSKVFIVQGEINASSAKQALPPRRSRSLSRMIPGKIKRRLRRMLK